MVAALLLAGSAGAATVPFDAKPGQGNEGFRFKDGTVTPRQAIPFSVQPVRFHFRFAARQSMKVVIRVYLVAGGRKRVIRRIVTGRLQPGRWHHRGWDGRTGRGRLAPAGHYGVFVGPVGGPFSGLGRVRLHGHQFPVDGPHGTRGYIGEFGAPRVDGRTHEGFDVTAACGTPLVAVRAGTILKADYDPELYGNFVVLKGEGERRTYKYSHLLRPAAVRKGQIVRAGRRLGSVGQTGNAASTPCHLHIEIRTRGRLLNPEPILDSWDW